MAFKPPVTKHAKDPKAIRTSILGEKCIADRQADLRVSLPGKTKTMTLKPIMPYMYKVSLGHIMPEIQLGIIHSIMIVVATQAKTI